MACWLCRLLAWLRRGVHALCRGQEGDAPLPGTVPADESLREGGVVVTRALPLSLPSAAQCLEPHATVVLKAVGELSLLLLEVKRGVALGFSPLERVQALRVERV